MVVISAPVIKGLAQDAADSLGRTPYWEAAFSQTTMHLTELVYWHPAHTRAYYVVGFDINNRPTGRLRIDAETGAISEIIGVDNAQRSLPVFIPRDDLLTRLRAQTIRMATPAMAPFDQLHADVDANMSWMPCDQSRTPFLPFYVVHDGPREVWVRADGIAFDGPTNHGGA